MAISLKTSTVIALALASVTLPSTVNAATVVNASTGQPGLSNGAAKGQIDPKWLINGNPALTASLINGGWSGANTNPALTNGNADGARWITPGLPGTGNVAGGTVAYTTMFTLSNIVNVSTARLNGKFWADNRVTSIILNGVTIFTNGSGASQFAPLAFGTLLNAGGGKFVSGSNTLIFNLQNDGGTGTNPAGLKAQLEVMAAIPEPATWLLMLMGFGFVGFQMRRRQNTQVRFQFA